MKPWREMNTTEKLDALQREMAQITDALHALTSDLDATWAGMRETRAAVGKITKDVATLRALWPRRYSQAAE